VKKRRLLLTIKNCGECPYAHQLPVIAMCSNPDAMREQGSRIGLTNLAVFPEWCPLPEVGDKNEDD